MIPYIEYRNSELYIESIAVSEIAEEFGTPTYVYSKKLIEDAFISYKTALSSNENLICYAVKANSNLAILDILARLGAGFDIVSEGELNRVLTAGGDPRRVVFSGVGKTNSEIITALKSNIYCFNVESEHELKLLNEIARENDCEAPISIRINPDINASTHPYIATGMRENKFGVSKIEAIELYKQAMKLNNINIQGIDCHIGSQLTEIDPIVDSIRQLLEIIATLGKYDIKLKHINLGGGLGITYNKEKPPSISAYAGAILRELKDQDIKIILEPGRSIVGNAGFLVAKVQYLKTTPYRNFAIVDAAMNDLLRPALYDAWLEIVPTSQKNTGIAKTWDIVGPVCESADFLGNQRNLCLNKGDTLAILGAGAYGFSMSSNYNSRCRASEIIVNGSKVHVARKRETFKDLISGEACMPKDFVE